MANEIITYNGSKIINYMICFPISDFGYLVKTIEKVDILDYDGNPSILGMDKYNVLNNNKLLFNEWYDEISFEIRNDYCIFEINKKYGVFDKEGNIIIKPIYDNLYYDSDDIFMARNNNKFGFVNSKYQMTPIIFSNASFFYDDYAAVRYNHKWGFINKYDYITNPNNDEEYSIAPEYEQVEDFEKGKCLVVKGEYEYIIDKQNNIVNSKIKIKTKH